MGSLNSVEFVSRSSFIVVGLFGQTPLSVLTLYFTHEHNFVKELILAWTRTQKERDNKHLSRTQKVSIRMNRIYLPYYSYQHGSHKF